MFPDHSSAFPNLQQLLQHVQQVTDAASEVSPEVPMPSAAGFPTLSSMLLAASSVKPAAVTLPPVEPEPLILEEPSAPVLEPVADAEPLIVEPSDIVPEEALVEVAALAEEPVESIEVHEEHDEHADHLEEEVEEMEVIETSPFAAMAEAHEPPHQEEGEGHGISLLPHSATHQEWDGEGWENRGASLAVGGAILISLAIVLANSVAGTWVEAIRHEGAMAEMWRSLALAKTWFYGLGAVGLTVLGMGSLVRRRWAVPLVHAGGWLSAISTMMALAVGSAGFFFLFPNVAKSDLSAIGRGLILLGAFGLVLPLILIAIYQRRHLPYVCARADETSRWTDRLPEPLLMLWECCLLVAAALSALFFLNGGFPLFGRMATGALGWACTGVSVVGLLVSARLLAKQIRTGWWLALVLFTAIAASGIWTFVKVPMFEVLAAWGFPADDDAAPASSKILALLVGAIYAPLTMVLLMSRTSFPTPEDEIPEDARLPDAQS